MNELLSISDYETRAGEIRSFEFEQFQGYVDPRDSCLITVDRVTFSCDSISS